MAFISPLRHWWHSGRYHCETAVQPHLSSARQPCVYSETPVGHESSLRPLVSALERNFLFFLVKLGGGRRVCLQSIPTGSALKGDDQGVSHTAQRVSPGPCRAHGPPGPSAHSQSGFSGPLNAFID
ncbi:unnamed protein product [Gadus morhua 'NCC']